MSLHPGNLESQTCSPLFELVKDYLTKLSFCDRFLDDLSTNEEESIEFLTTTFSLFRELGKLSYNSSKVSELTTKFREALKKNKNKQVDIEKVFNSKYSGDREWFDEVNYIYVWVLNSYGLNLKTSSVSEIKSQFSSNEIIEVEVQSEEQARESGKTKTSFFGKTNRSSSKNWGGLSVYRNIFRTSRLGDMNEDESFEYIVSKTQALERLEREIRSGRVYVYLSKPSKNPILKKYFSYLCLIGLVFSSITFLVAVITAIKGNSSDNSNHKWHPTLFTVMSFIFFFLSWRENNRGLENENFKYCFSRKIFFYYFFLTSWFLLSSIGGGASQDAGYSSLFSSQDVWSKVFFALLVSVVIISVTFFLVGYFFLNPKKNKELIERLLHKYSSPPYLNR